MANISTANGVIKIKGDTSITVNILLKAFKILEDGEYTTFFYETLRRSNTTAISKFDGAGRWSYDENIKSFPYWALDRLEKEDQVFLQNSEWLINYNYYDIEPGCEYIALMNLDFVHHKGDDLHNNSIIKHKEEYPDYNWVNIIHFNWNDALNEFIESEFYDDSDDVLEDFIDAWNYNKGRLLEYFDCSLEELYDKAPALKEKVDLCNEKGIN